MGYQYVIFDMDGTVLDTLEDLKDAVNRSLAAHKLPQISLEQARCYVGNGASRLIERAVPAGSAPELSAQVLETFKADYKKNSLVKTAPYAGILPLMERLRAKGKRLAVVSNKPDFAVQDLAEQCFSGLFDLALGQRDEIPRKPAPDMVEFCLRELGAEKTAAVYVGDSEVDVATAKNAGLDGIAVTWGFRSREELLTAGAERFADTMEDLERLLD